MKNLLLTWGYKYISNGICVIAANNEKRSFLSWKKYQETIITIEEAELQFEDPRATNLAIICGVASGNLEVIDIDSKYDLTGTLYQDYLQAIRDNDEELADKLMIIQTISGGYHLYYRCEKIEGNQKLAQRPASPEELAMDSNDKIRVLLETRGQGGYVIAPPSSGYKVISGERIPTISTDERETLLGLARTFDQIIEAPTNNERQGAYDKTKFTTSPFDDYNERGDALSVLEGHGWIKIRETAERIIYRRPGKDKGTSGDYLKAKKWFKVFTTSSLFYPGKAYLPYAVYAMLNCNGDFKTTAKKLYSEGYGQQREYYGEKLEKQLYKKKIEGATREELVGFLMERENKKQEQAEEIVANMEKIWGDKLCTFWDNNDGRAVINRTRLIRFLEAGGFGLYYYDKASTIYRIIQIRDGFIEEVSAEHIKKYLKTHINNLPDTFDGGITPDDLSEIIYKGATTFFGSSMLEFINRTEIDLLKHTEKEAFFTFRNGVAIVTKDSVTLKGYKDINKVVWKSQVIDFDIAIEKDIDYPAVEFMHFLNCVCDHDDNKRDYVVSLVGYLLHEYKDPTKPYSVVLAEETENESEGGGTGKGILITGIGKLINTVRIDGKNFKLDKTFAFQRVGLDTRMVAIEDLRKNVDFEGFYSIITEGITIEKKNKDELFIPYKDSPKIIFTTNYTIPNTGNHAKRRQKVFEFSSFFRPAYTPEDHFKHKLFDDWDRDEWNRFYNTLFTCVHIYLSEGIKEQTNSNSIKRKQIKLSYTEEFLEWLDDYTGNGCDLWKPIHDLHVQFCQSSDTSDKDYSMKRFKSALTKSAELLGYKLEVRRNQQTPGSKREVRYTRLT